MKLSASDPPIENWQIDELLAQLASSLSAFLTLHNRPKPVLIGLHRGGVWVARALHQLLGEQFKLEAPVGSLDISFYRDDFATAGLQGGTQASSLPVDIDGKHLVLIDDILYTGRTIRAAMNELFDYGRPASITLVVLIERDGRELPIQADCVAARIKLPANQVLKLSQNPKGKLELVLHERTGAQGANR